MVKPQIAVKGAPSPINFRMIFTAGMGFFTGAYDLFIIGVVTAILLPIWHLSTLQLSVLNASSLAAAALGAACYGTIADIVGRKKIYGFEVLILFVGAILSALAQDFTQLFIARMIIGFGIGCDYPISAVFASESVGTERRGMVVLLAFAMQALGLIITPLLASLLLVSPLEHGMVWRLLLGLGAVPAASVYFLRRSIAETPRFLKLQQSVNLDRPDKPHIESEGDVVHLQFKKHRLRERRWLTYLIATAGSWFLLDVAFYGNGVSAVLVMQHLAPHASLLQHTLLSALIFIVCAAPGYVLAARYVDSIGRKRLQMLGFSVMALAYGAIAFIPSVTSHIVMFTLIYGLSFFFVNFGPNTTTFLIPAEIFPTSIRAKAHGLSAAVGKVGAFGGALLLPLILHRYGLNLTMATMAVVAVIGLLLTLILPEMKGISLESQEMLPQTDASNKAAGAGWR